MPTTFAPGPVAILDVETTGLHPKFGDRVLEIAVVVLNPDGETEREFTSLVNANRDIGAAKIHGITSADIVNAPKFDQIAGHVLEALQGCIAIAGHNVRFDNSFFKHEFEKMGIELPEYFSLCTMHLAGKGKLAACCERHGIETGDTQHEALVDARLTAKLLTRCLPSHPDKVDQLFQARSIAWPAVSKTNAIPFTRQCSQKMKTEPPKYIEELLKRTHENNVDFNFSEAQVDYMDMLDRALEDRLVDDKEAKALLETAMEWGLSGAQVLEIHDVYLNQILDTAMQDGKLTPFEEKDLIMVAGLLGKKKPEVLKLIAAKKKNKPDTDKPAPAARPVADIKGKKVCFTGELCCTLDGTKITRERAQSLSIEAGLEVHDRVTKKLDILVLADPQSASDKAKKARSYGVQIMHENTFWKTLGIKVD